MLWRFTFCFLLMTCPLAQSVQQSDSVPQSENGFEISGVLVDADSGQPLPHSHLDLAALNQRNDPAVTITDGDGRFAFFGLAPGKYSLSAQARGHLQQRYAQHEQYSTAIAAGPGMVSTGLIFKLPGESSIFGIVTDEAGEAVREAVVTLYFSGLAAGATVTHVHSSAVTNDEGKYYFVHLGPGRYLISVSTRPWYASAMNWSRPEDSHENRAPAAGEISAEPGSSPLDVAYPITFYGGGSEARSASEIVLGRGEKFTANIALQPVPALRLRIATANDAPQGTFVTLEQRTADGSMEHVDVARQWSGPGVSILDGVPPGHYLVRTHERLSGMPSDGPLLQIDVNSNGSIDGIEGTIYVPVSVTVRADASGLPGQTFIQLLDKKTRVTLVERVGPEGEAVFKQRVEPGSYEVSCTGDVNFYLKSLTATGAKVLGRTVEIRPGDAVKLTVTTAHGEGEVNGTALRDGTPFGGALIMLVPEDPGHNQILFRRDQSDSDGTFTLKNVVPGKYTVLAIANGWELEWTKITVLRKYMGAGSAVVVQPSGKYDLKVSVQ